MSERMPTAEQEAAIAASGRDVLVEAGAGTGKTGVMVDRYCRLVCDGGASPETILAFTFTEKAAAELRQRIRSALELRAGAGSERARELLGGLGGAWVTTIHGFCNRLLAAHPVAVGIDPRFRVLDAPEAEREAHGAFDDALEAFLADGEEARETTVAAFDIAGLRAMVLGAHAELRSRGMTDPRLAEPPPADLGMALREAAEAATATLEELRPADPNRELVERALATFSREEGDALTLDQLDALRTESRAKSMAGYREAIDTAVTRVAEAGEGGVAYRHLAELLELFSARFAAAKARRGGIDFEDLQLLAVRLLEQTETGAAYRTRFSHLLVDEFQDTNRLQLRLIEALRGPGSKLMVVGDELQSIYGFRHADLDVFREQRRAIEASRDGEAIALSGNFRSRPELIGAVNAVGEKLLGDGFRPLRVGALPASHTSPGDRPPVELLLTGRDGWDGEGIELEPSIDARTPLNQLAEARFLAARLRELADAGVERGEMVVLLRAFTHLDAHEDSLERAGLRPYVVGGRGYWSQQQVSDVCALLATIANPLDDQALFGALASPACGVAPDTLWLLRAAAGRGRSVWRTVEQATGLGEAELSDPQRLGQIPAAELALLSRFARRLVALRERAPYLPLADLIDAAVTETGYDLAVLMRSAGEARFANLRKLMRLAAEFEAGEGRDLRGLLDFLAARAEVDGDAQAATAVEGHDGVRIMTIHSAKGLEFGVVAVPHLSRSLLSGSRTPLLTLGHEAEAPRVGMQLRRLGAPSLNLYAHRELREEAQRRDAEEELRLFHVAATRARERLILSGVVRPEAAREASPGTPVVERIVEAFGIDRTEDSAVRIPAAQPREGLEASFEPAEIAIRVNLASSERADLLASVRRDESAVPDLGVGPAPLLAQRVLTVPSQPLSYTAIAKHGELPDPTVNGRSSSRSADLNATATGERPARERDAATARGIAVHNLLEWSANNGWRAPPGELARRFAAAAGFAPGSEEAGTALLDPVQAWLASELFGERVRPAERSRAEVPLLLQLGGTVLRGSIDLLVEREDGPPLIVDYKTDRLDGASPITLAGRYEIQRDIYALAVSESLQIDRVETAYVFLEQPQRPVLVQLDAGEIDLGRARLVEAIERIRSEPEAA
ncbi:MAG TPA: UvrD-helicase domain-containing protein [Solirubrobacterales bacterium]|nr:UvrD-helicase domain-containing protein [Solirubrobacterales bacterium]